LYDKLGEENENNEENETIKKNSNSDIELIDDIKAEAFLDKCKKDENKINLKRRNFNNRKKSYPNVVSSSNKIFTSDLQAKKYVDNQFKKWEKNTKEDIFNLISNDNFFK